MRFIIFLFGILAGWFLKEVDWETFAQLGALTPQELEEIVGASIRRITNEEEIINQAKKLAA